jgi:hypothetical protein
VSSCVFELGLQSLLKANFEGDNNDPLEVETD